MKYNLVVRCPVCNGSGGVAPNFGSGQNGATTEDGKWNTYASNISGMVCPACGGTGMQTVEVEE